MDMRRNGQESDPTIRMDEQERRAWARKIKPARQEKGLTQDELEMMSGVSRRTIGNIESGRMVPQAGNLRKLMMALDLGPDPTESLPDWVHTWIAVLGPLIQAVPEPRRNDTMLEVVQLLGNAVAGTGSRPAAVAGEPTASRSADNVHALNPRNQGLNPDGMPPFDESDMLAARHVPDELSSLRPKTPNPEDFPDEDGPENGA